MLFLYCLLDMHEKPVLTSSRLIKLATATKVDAITKRQMSSGKFHVCLVMLLIDKLDADAIHQMPMMESSIVTAKIPFVLWTNTNVTLSRQVNHSWGRKSHNFSFNLIKSFCSVSCQKKAKTHAMLLKKLT